MARRVTALSNPSVCLSLTLPSDFRSFPGPRDLEEVADLKEKNARLMEKLTQSAGRVSEVLLMPSGMAADSQLTFLLGEEKRTNRECKQRVNAFMDELRKKNEMIAQWMGVDALNDDEEVSEDKDTAKNQDKGKSSNGQKADEKGGKNVGKAKGSMEMLYDFDKDADSSEDHASDTVV